MASSRACLPIEHADAGRTVQLVRGERVEVAVEILHVDLGVRHGLRPVDEHGHALRVRRADDLLHRVDGAERVRHVHDADQLRARTEQLQVFVEDELAVIVDRDDLEHGTSLLAHHLPRHDVGMVFHGRQNDLVARLQPRPREALRHEVDGLGRAAREDDLFGMARIEQMLDLDPRILERLGRLLRQGVHAAMDVRVEVPVVVGFGRDHHLRFLRGGSVVEIDQLLAVHALLQDRKIRAPVRRDSGSTPGTRRTRRRP